MFKILLSLISFLFIGAAHATEFPPNAEANKKVIEALIKAGSNPNKLHSIEHHFICKDKSSLNALMKKGESLGYRVAHLGYDDSDGARRWYGDLIKETILDLELINKEDSLMLKLADQFGATYDGWGAEVVD